MTTEQTAMLVDFVHACEGRLGWREFCGKWTMPSYLADRNWQQFSDWIQKTAHRVLKRLEQMELPQDAAETEPHDAA